MPADSADSVDSTSDPPNDSGCAGKLRVLADPTRLRVVETLMKEPRCVHELMELLDVEQSLLSHHLRVLRDAGLVEGVRQGRAVLYRLAPGAEGDASAIDLGCCRLSFDDADTVVA